VIFVLDTHAFVWHLTNSRRLSKKARAILDDPEALLVLPAIALAELRFLADRGRIEISWTDIRWALAADDRCAVHATDETVVEHMPPGLDIHDAIICGTAILRREVFGEDVAVITRDKDIRDSGLVETVW